jgi:glyoxylase-like metal-dependent hydrolase (beta-lactamase superfamily II)
MVATPGHVPTHMSVVVKLEGLYYFLAGDASYNQENMLKRISDGIGNKDSLATLEKIQQFTRQYPTVYLPSHDPESAKRLEGQITLPLHEKTLFNS